MPLLSARAQRVFLSSGRHGQTRSRGAVLATSGAAPDGISGGSPLEVAAGHSARDEEGETEAQVGQVGGRR